MTSGSKGRNVNVGDLSQVDSDYEQNTTVGLVFINIIHFFMALSHHIDITSLESALQLV